MNVVTCLTWLQRGVAKSIPDKLELSTDELKRLISETKTDNELENDGDSEITEDDTEDKHVPEVDGDEDFDAKYNLNSYDDDEKDPIFNMADLMVYADNKDDNYIMTEDKEDEDEIEEQEDFTIKDTDNLLVVGHVEDESSVMEIYVYNKEEDAFYVHHDIVLPAYPLAIEWLDFHPSDDVLGNFVAVGDMTPVIKIWDLDVVDILEPDYTLGKLYKKKPKTKKTNMNKGHSDAVLSLSWNKYVKNILASGSADSTVGLWDLQNQKILTKLCFHTNKVQSIQWHPFECHFLLSGCVDGLVKLYDCRTPDTAFKSWQVDGEIEKVLWNLFQPFSLFCSNDKGYVYNMDMRKSDIVYSFKPHNDAVTGLDMSPLCPNSLITASMDRIIKIWNLEKEPVLVKTQKLKVGSIYAAKIAPDLAFTVAVGGNNESNNIKIIDVMEDTKCFELFNERIQKKPAQIKIEQDSKDVETEIVESKPIETHSKVVNSVKEKKKKKACLKLQINNGQEGSQDAESDVIKSQSIEPYSEVVNSIKQKKKKKVCLKLPIKEEQEDAQDMEMEVVKSKPIESCSDILNSFKRKKNACLKHQINNEQEDSQELERGVLKSQSIEPYFKEVNSAKKKKKACLKLQLKDKQDSQNMEIKVANPKQIESFSEVLSSVKQGKKKSLFKTPN